MSRIKSAISKVAQAQRHYSEAFEELKRATHELMELVEQEQTQQWQEITKATTGKARRPKGEIQEMITTIFHRGVPGQLSFPQIYEAVKNQCIIPPSHSTVRQTLYRMRAEQLLESYSGRWSPGLKLKQKAQ